MEVSVEFVDVSAVTGRQPCAKHVLGRAWRCVDHVDAGSKRQVYSLAATAAIRNSRSAQTGQNAITSAGASSSPGSRPRSATQPGAGSLTHSHSAHVNGRQPTTHPGEHQRITATGGGVPVPSGRKVVSSSVRSTPAHARQRLRRDLSLDPSAPRALSSRTRCTSLLHSVRRHRRQATLPGNDRGSSRQVLALRIPTGSPTSPG